MASYRNRAKHYSNILGIKLPPVPKKLPKKAVKPLVKSNTARITLYLEESTILEIDHTVRGSLFKNKTAFFKVSILFFVFCCLKDSNHHSRKVSIDNKNIPTNKQRYKVTLRKDFVKILSTLQAGFKFPSRSSLLGHIVYHFLSLMEPSVVLKN